jgi:hypothetical protein
MFRRRGIAGWRGCVTVTGIHGCASRSTRISGSVCSRRCVVRGGEYLCICGAHSKPFPAGGVDVKYASTSILSACKNVCDSRPSSAMRIVPQDCAPIICANPILSAVSTQALIAVHSLTLGATITTAEIIRIVQMRHFETNSGLFSDCSRSVSRRILAVNLHCHSPRSLCEEEQ